MRIACGVCFRHCRPGDGRPGFCRARVGQGGAVVSGSYGKITAMALDPIEKKPLYHFHPGGKVLSVGSYGCNMACGFCQNHDISQTGAEAAWETISPEALAQKALELAPAGNIGLAFTYNEPAVGWEFVRDAGRESKRLGLANVMVTNGCFERWVLDELLGVIDAFNIDLKCFTKEGYAALGGDFASVQSTIAAAARTAHVEVTCLVVPGLSDSPRDMEAQAKWLASLSSDIPLHITRYFPRWQAKQPPTSLAVLEGLAGIARAELRHVHLGNC